MKITKRFLFGILTICMILSVCMSGFYPITTVYAEENEEGRPAGSWRAVLRSEVFQYIDETCQNIQNAFPGGKFTHWTDSDPWVWQSQESSGDGLNFVFWGGNGNQPEDNYDESGGCPAPKSSANCRKVTGSIDHFVEFEGDQTIEEFAACLYPDGDYELSGDITWESAYFAVSSDDLSSAEVVTTPENTAMGAILAVIIRLPLKDADHIKLVISVTDDGYITHDSWVQMSFDPTGTYYFHGVEGFLAQGMIDSSYTEDDLDAVITISEDQYGNYYMTLDRPIRKLLFNEEKDNAVGNILARFAVGGSWTDPDDESIYPLTVKLTKTGTMLGNGYILGDEQEYPTSCWKYTDGNFVKVQYVFEDGYNIIFQPMEDAAGTGSEVSTQTVKFNDQLEIDLNWGWDLFGKSASVYDHDLAMAGLILSQAAESGSSEIASRYKELGFENIALNENYDAVWKLYEPAFAVASKRICLNGEYKYLLSITIRGTDPGTGDVWTDLSSQSFGFTNGFNQASMVVQAEFQQYYSQLTGYYSGCEAPNINNTLLFITGHSMGGAVAGLISKGLEGTIASRDNIFTYTFASANYETSLWDRESFTNIHNIINTADIVPDLPTPTLVILNPVSFILGKNGHFWYYSWDSEGNDFINVLNRCYGCRFSAKELLSQYLQDGFQHDCRTYLAFMISGLPSNMGSGTETHYSISSLHSNSEE